MDTSLGLIQTKNGNGPQRSFGETLGFEMMELKKKLTTLVINVEGLESTVERLKQKKKNRYTHIENTVQAEIETLKLFKDRVDLEL